MTKNKPGVDTKNIDLFRHSWYNIDVRLDSEYTCDRDAWVNDLSIAVEGTELIMTKRDWNNIDVASRILLIAGILGIAFGKFKEASFFLAWMGSLLYVAGDLVAQKELLSTTLEMRVLLKLRGELYIAQVYVDRQTGRLYPPHDPEERRIMKATHQHMKDPQLFRAPLYREQGGTVSMPGETYTVHEFESF
jgi:hypothetical protein